ncbi:DUF6049 family protein [Nocardiopsis sediminis]|uniref:DUF6049 family protein n=1 Tax=Nocardiopsis sediminis TaxID=1778267 RepID=A0ABV8FP00_9ACTN
MRRFAHVGAVAATTAVLIPALAAFDHAQAPALTAPLEDSDDAAPLIIEEITPTAVEEDSTVRVTGTVTNTTDSPLDEVTVRLRYSATPFGSRSELDDYADHGADLPATGPTATVDGPIEPGESADYTVEADAEDLGLGAFGVYPLSVEAAGPSGGALGEQHTFLPYRGGGSGPDAVEIAWVWPLMGTPQRAGDDVYLSDGLSESVGPEGRLGRLLTAGAQDDAITLEPPATPSPVVSEGDAGQDAASGDDPGDAPRATGDSDRVPVTWAVDPALLDDVARLTEGPYDVVTDPGEAGGDNDDAAPATESMDPSLNAQVWLDQARTALAGDPLIATPYAAPDIAALLRADLGADAEAAVPLGQDAVERILDRPADDAYAWPAGGVMDGATREFYAGQGATRFLLSDAAMPARQWSTATPTAEASLPLPGDEDGTALVADSRLTAVLGRDSTGPGQAALAQQRFAAETAMISAEDPGTDRTIVAAPPTDWTPSAAFAEGVLQASDDLPWLDPVALDDIKADPDAEPQRGDLVYPERALDRELSGDHLDEVAGIRRDVRLFNSILEDDADPFRPAILRLEAAAWREDDDLAATTRALVAHNVQADMDKVRIIPGEPVTLASKTGTIGILVANDLEDHTVRLKLSMLSTNPERLSVEGGNGTMEIGPGGKTTVYVPLSARINGRTVLQLSLHNTEGEPVSGEQALDVNATGLGNQALLISGAGALVLVVALAPRAVRKWARTRAAAAGAAPDPDAASGDGDGNTADTAGTATDTGDDSGTPAPKDDDKGGA